MRGTVAKRIRKAVYGKGTHPSQVTYHTVSLNSKTVVADPARWSYQQAKRRYTRRID